MTDSIDRTPKPCNHKQANHQHGTRLAYTLDECRCYACSYARSIYQQKLETGQFAGNFTDAEPVRKWVLWLMDNGIGYRRVAALAGVSKTSVFSLIFGSAKSHRPIARVSSENARKLLALTLDPEPEGDRTVVRRAAGANVSSLGTARRIQALVALGWTQAYIARQLGITPANFTPLAHGRRPVTQGTADKVAALYDRMSMQHPPERNHHERIAASRARNTAKARGWLAPLAWDDEFLDDPDYQPQMPKDTGLCKVTELDEAAIDRRLHGDKKVRLSKADKVELVRRWLASGRSWSECEELTGVNVERFREKPAEGAEQGAEQGAETAA